MADTSHTNLKWGPAFAITMKENALNHASDDTAQVLMVDLPEAPTVLIVDDDELVLSRLKNLVSAAGYPVCTANSALQALDMLQTSPASIIVTDLDMPGIGGLELCRRIRALSREYAYIILLTISYEEPDILAGLDAGADDYISKRTSAALFTARLRTANRVLALQHSLRSALDKKHTLSMTDELTGVHNRRFFMRRLTAELMHRQCFGGDVSLLLFDVDHFKKINDTHGHAAGDIALAALTGQVADCMRHGSDWCARLGGDEFVVVLEGTGLAEARVCAERIRAAIARHHFSTGTDCINVTVSVGLSGLEAVADRHAATPLSLLALADANLFASKVGGRNRVTSPNPCAAPAMAAMSSTLGETLVHTKAAVRSLR